MKNILLFAAIIALSFSLTDQAHAMHLEYKSTIEFHDDKPVWYKSTYNKYLNASVIKLQIPLEPTDGTDGDWSMQITNPDKSKSNGNAKLEQKIFFLGMRYHFK